MASILVAENNNALLRLMDSVLTAAGHEVIMAGDAIEAGELAQNTKKPIDLLCTHLAMERESGAVLADQLTKAHPAMKVLFIITENPRYVVVDTPEICRQNPSFSVLRKPFTLPQLVAKVEGMLTRAS